MGIWCKHYRGMSGKSACEAGVVFASLPNYGTSAFRDSCPCFAPVGGCDASEYPTAEEIAEERRLLDELCANVSKAREAIVAACGGPWNRGKASKAGAIDCPVCGTGGALQYRRAGSNGHIHAACLTDGCVSWME